MRAVVAAAVLLAFVSCGNACDAPRLRPRHLPPGLHAVHAKAFVPSEWSQTWTDGTRTLQIDGGVTANLGEDSRRATVRGHRARYGPTGNATAPLAVEWTELAGCGSTVYAVIASGIPAVELLRIANGLRPG